MNLLVYASILFNMSSFEQFWKLLKSIDTGSDELLDNVDVSTAGFSLLKWCYEFAGLAIVCKGALVFPCTTVVILLHDFWLFLWICVSYLHTDVFAWFLNFWGFFGGGCSDLHASINVGEMCRHQIQENISSGCRKQAKLSLLTLVARPLTATTTVQLFPLATIGHQKLF